MYTHIKDERIRRPLTNERLFPLESVAGKVVTPATMLQCANEEPVRLESVAERVRVYSAAAIESGSAGDIWDVKMYNWEGWG